MLSRDRKRQLIGLAVFALPIGLLKGTGLLFGGAAPSDAAASTGAVGGPVVNDHDAVTSELRWSPRQLELAEYVARLQEEPFGDSPLRPLSRGRRAEVEPTPPPVKEHPLQVVVTGIIHGGSGAIAWIDGTAHRVGDTVQDHRWEIIAIDAAARSVRFRHTANGEEVVKTLPMPR